MKFENNFTYLRNLKGGDKFTSKVGTVLKYLEDIGNDRHLLYSEKCKRMFVVPNGSFPVFKQIVK